MNIYVVWMSKEVSVNSLQMQSLLRQCFNSVVWTDRMNDYSVLFKTMRYQCC